MPNLKGKVLQLFTLRTNLFNLNFHQNQVIITVILSTSKEYKNHIL